VTGAHDLASQLGTSRQTASFLETKIETENRIPIASIGHQFHLSSNWLQTAAFRYGSIENSVNVNINATAPRPK
jgi:DNA-binding XRE family transcriptional regulator